MEALTDEIEKEAYKYIERIDEIGGAVQAVEEGYMQREIHQNAYQIQKDIENKDEIIVGLNKFELEDEPEAELMKVDEVLEKNQIASLQKVREERDNEKVNSALEALRENARKEDVNLIPYILDAVRVYASVGEICNVLREEFGEYAGV